MPPRKARPRQKFAIDQAEEVIHPDYDEVDEGLDRAKGGLFDDG